MKCSKQQQQAKHGTILQPMHPAGAKAIQLIGREDNGTMLRRPCGCLTRREGRNAENSGRNIKIFCNNSILLKLQLFLDKYLFFFALINTS